MDWLTLARDVRLLVEDTLQRLRQVSPDARVESVPAAELIARLDRRRERLIAVEESYLAVALPARLAAADEVVAAGLAERLGEIQRLVAGRDPAGPEVIATVLREVDSLADSYLKSGPHGPGALRAGPHGPGRGRPGGLKSPGGGG